MSVSSKKSRDHELVTNRFLLSRDGRFDAMSVTHGLSYFYFSLSFSIPEKKNNASREKINDNC